MNIVDDIIHDTLIKNKNKNSLISKIHNDINTRYNSVNVIVGKQSLGKTVIALKEIIKISLLNTHHLLIYVTKNGDENDKTWLSLKHLIHIPYVIVSEENVKKLVEELIAAKNLYYLVKREKLTNKIIDEQKEDMFQVLHINDFTKENLHTLVLFDDISNSKLFNNEESYFSQLLRRCRHTNMSYYLLIQSWKGLKPHIKNEITTLYILPCFNKQQLHYIYSQSASNLDFDDFYRLYTQASNHKCLIIQVIEGGETKLVDNE